MPSDPLLLALPACRDLAKRIAAIWLGATPASIVDEIAQRNADLDYQQTRNNWVAWGAERGHDWRPIRDDKAALRAAILEVCHAE